MSEQEPPPQSDADELAADDLERAYQAALEKLDVAEQAMEQAWLSLNSDHVSTDVEAPDATGDTTGPRDSESAASPQTEAATDADASGEHDLAATAASLLAEFESDPMPGAGPQVRPRQILEAALFVGGHPLTSKRMCSLLKRQFDQEYVERKLAELNDLYAEQGRPYEIRLEEGGYRMQLRSEFEEVRHRVYGLGPREVKLSQEALEVLSFVAYRQPATRQDLEDAGKQNCASVLRQLLRRDLLQLEREPEHGDVRYRTTSRFLELFGLSELEELPTNEDFDFK